MEFKKVPHFGSVVKKDINHFRSCNVSLPTCKCEEQILIVDDTEYNLLPLIYFIGQLKGSKANSVSNLSHLNNSSLIKQPSDSDQSYQINSQSVHLDQGIKPLIARNGEEAVNIFKERLNLPCKCKKKHIKLIIMDLMMPVMDGFEATEKILEI